jgi:hypothetical protein
MGPKETMLLAFGVAAVLVLVGAKANRNTKHPIIFASIVAVAVTIVAWGMLIWVTSPD